MPPSHGRRGLALLPIPPARKRGGIHPTGDLRMKLSRQIAAAGILALGFAASALAQDNKLRLITWADYVPADVARAVQEGDRHRRRDHALQQRGDDLEAARDGRRRLRPRAAVAGPHRRPAAGVRHLQADGHDEDQDRSLHSVDARRDEEEHDAQGRRCTGCRTSGAPTASSSTPSSRR